MEIKITDEQMKEIESNILSKSTDYEFEEKKLQSTLGKYEVDLLKKYNLIVAGGSIASIFTNTQINDFDVYARSKEELIGFAKELDDDGYSIMSLTSKSATFVNGEKIIQLIFFKFFNSVEEIFNSFDFTNVMGAYDFKENNFYLHKNFLKHNSQRILKFNDGTNYPLVSVIRVGKYQDRGYTISKSEYMRIILTCMQLEINTYQELKEHLGGMYGVNLDKLFDDCDENEFSLSNAVAKLADITLSDDYFEKPSITFEYSIDDVLDTIEGVIPKYIEHLGQLYQIEHNGEVCKVAKKVGKYEMIKLEDVESFKDKKLYKFVKKNGDGTYVSIHSNKFIYEIGKVAEATGDYKLEVSCGAGKLHFNTKDTIKKSTYYDNNGTLLECEVEFEDLINLDTSNKVTARKVKVLREVPTDEWRQWVKDKNGVSSELLF